MPYYDRSVTYSVASFYDHSLQSIMAVFIAKTPKLGAELLACSPSERQDYFFYLFRKFANAYVNLSFDDDIYFSSTSKERAGTQGGGIRSGKFFIDRQKTAQSNHAAKIKYFEKKFSCYISGDRDQRLFLGVNQIWNRVAIEGPELLSSHMDAIASSYDDESFATPIPNKLNRYLVPLKIRNKVVQKWSNRFRSSRVSPISKESEEEDPPAITTTTTSASEVWRIQPVEVEEDW